MSLYQLTADFFAVVAPHLYQLTQEAYVQSICASHSFCTELDFIENKRFTWVSVPS